MAFKKWQKSPSKKPPKKEELIVTASGQPAKKLSYAQVELSHVEGRTSSSGFLSTKKTYTEAVSLASSNNGNLQRPFGDAQDEDGTALYGNSKIDVEEGHGGWFSKNPYLTNHQNVRKALNTYVSDYGLEKDYGGAGISLNENSPIYRKLRHAFMMGKAEGENGYINTYWSAYYEFLDNALQENPGISYKGAKKIAETKLRSHIQSYDPIFFSENSEKGKIHIRQFEKRLTPEYKALLKKLKTEYKYKVRKFKRDIERTASRFTYK